MVVAQLSWWSTGLIIERFRNVDLTFDAVASVCGSASRLLKKGSKMVVLLFYHSSQFLKLIHLRFP